MLDKREVACPKRWQVKGMERRQTNVFFELFSVELVLNEGGRAKLGAQAREEAAQLALVWGHDLQPSGFPKLHFRDPVEGEALEKGRVVLVGGDHVESALPILEELLVQTQDHPPCHAIQADPRPITRVLGLKEVEEDIGRWRVPEMVA